MFFSSTTYVQHIQFIFSSSVRLRVCVNVDLRMNSDVTEISVRSLGDVCLTRVDLNALVTLNL
jgi:hypothetical protein